MKENSPSINIAIIFWHLGIGGVQRKIVDLSHFLDSPKYKLIKLHIILRDKTPFRMDKLINTETTKIYYIPKWFNGKIRPPFSLYALIKTFQIRPDTLLTFLDFASFFCLVIRKILFWRKIKVVLNEDSFTSSFTTSPVRRFLLKKLYPYADTIISPTLASRNDLVKNFQVPQEKTVVVSNWTLNSQVKMVKKSFLFDLLFAGRFDPQKNLLFLLKAVMKIKKKIPTIKACLIGDGEQKQLLKSFINSHHLQKNVFLIDGSYDLSESFLKSKIFTLTSDYEGMPIVLLEAMASKMAVVVRRFPGIEEYFINGKTGFIENNINDYCERIIQVLNSESLRIKLGNNAYTYIRKNFSTDVIQKYFNLLLPGSNIKTSFSEGPAARHLPDTPDKTAMIRKTSDSRHPLFFLF